MTRPKIGLFLGLLLLVGISLVEIPGMSGEARRMLAVAAIMATWWVTEAAPLAVTSLLPLVLLPVLGITDAAGAAAPYANHLVYLFLGGFMLAAAMQRWCLHRRIALRIVLAIGGSPSRIVLGFMAASAFLSMWVSNTATTAMMMPIGVAVAATIAESVHGPGRRSEAGAFPFAVCLMIGCAYGASIGGFATLIGTPPNVFLAGFLEQNLGVRISFVQWLAFALPLTLVFLPAVWLWLTRIAFPLRLEGIPGGSAPIRAAYEALGPISQPEKRLAALFGVTALAWMLRPVWTAFLPTGSLVTDSTIAMASTVACFLLPAGKDGERILDWASASKIPWDVLILFGGGFSLANGLEVSGLAQVVGDQLGAASVLPIPVFVILVTLGVILLTEFASNLASTAMIVPILATVAAAAGIPPLVLLVPATVAASCAFMLPAATPPNAIVFGTGLFTIPQMVRAGIGANLIGAVLASLFAVFWVPIVFG